MSSFGSGTSTPSESLGQELLSRVRRLDGRSAKELDELDCVLVESSRNDGATRAIHRCVLENGSDFFASEVARLRQTQKAGLQSEQWSNTLRLDASIETINMILEHLYTKEPIKITANYAVELYSAARRSGLAKVAQKVADYIQLNSQICLNEESLWINSKCVTDIDMLADIIEKLQLDNDCKISLMQRIILWGEKFPEKSPTALGMCRKLLFGSIVP